MSSLPTGWARASIGELAEITFDGPFGSNLKTADYTAKGVRVARLENVGRLRFIREKETFISPDKFSLLARHELRPGDILFASFVADDVRVCQVPKDIALPIINKADVFCIRVREEFMDRDFLAFRLAAKDIHEHLSNDIVHGATRPRVGLRDVQALILDVPPLFEQRRIAKRVESLRARAMRARGHLEHVLSSEANSARKLLDHLDAAILMKAARGKLVSQDPKEEPAALLLERIKAEKASRALGGKRRARRPQSTSL